MIPKMIHYCWFGENPLPEEYKRYIETWKKFCPDYEIKEWNESNFDVYQNSYCKEAYEAGKWAFVSDYARLKIIYDYGGIYLDTDVEVLKPLTPLISQGIGFVGFQNNEQVNTGLGFAAAPYNKCVRAMLDLYNDRHFVMATGKYDFTPCPIVNTIGLKKCGLKTEKKSAKYIQHLEGISVFPSFYFNPMNPDTLKICINENTYMVHHYAASWYDERKKIRKKLKRILPDWLLICRAQMISKRDMLRFERKIYNGKR